MLAYEKFGEGETPESSGIKGDHLIGKYYVRFDKEYKKHYQPEPDKYGLENFLILDIRLFKITAAHVT